MNEYIYFSIVLFFFLSVLHCRYARNMRAITSKVGKTRVSGIRVHFFMRQSESDVFLIVLKISFPTLEMHLLLIFSH